MSGVTHYHAKLAISPKGCLIYQHSNSLTIAKKLLNMIGKDCISNFSYLKFKRKTNFERRKSPLHLPFKGIKLFYLLTTSQKDSLKICSH